MNIKHYAQQILSLIDLTTLNNNDTDKTITNLCKNAQTNFGNVAAICIFSQFIPLAHSQLQNSGIKLATVVNFPHGMTDLDLTFFETELAVGRGAEEIDIVLPYHELIDGNTSIAETMLTEVREICDDVILKVILETGELKTPELIKLASNIALNSGADFLKTSTGKVQVNATLDATQVMLNTIKEHGGKCGFKAAGGIKTVSEAITYIELAKQIMGDDYIDNKTFRIGASSLINDVVKHLEYT